MNTQESVDIIGVGTFLPQKRVPTHDIVPLVRKSVEHLIQRKGYDCTVEGWLNNATGIRERRTLDPGTCDEVEAARRAAEDALRDAGRFVPGFDRDKIDVVFCVSCTQTPNQIYNRGLSTALHKALQFGPEQVVREVVAGCAGALEALAMAYQSLRPGQCALVIASNYASQHARYAELYAEKGAWLSMALFGDGAGALVVSKEKYQGYLQIDKVVERQWTQKLIDITLHGTDSGEVETVYKLNGKAIAAKYEAMMTELVEALTDGSADKCTVFEQGMVIAHPANARLVLSWAEGQLFDLVQVPLLADMLGNMSAATVIVTLAQVLRSKELTQGSHVLLVAIGAPANGVALHATVR